MRSVFIIVGTLSLALTCTSLKAANPSSTLVWFGGEDPVTVRDKRRAQPADFMALFAPGAPWQRAAAGVNAFKISMQFATGASDADLLTVIHDLDRRGIKLAIETGMLRNNRGCGKGEGYIPQDLLTLAMTRIQKLGGELAYIAMDEVVFLDGKNTGLISLIRCRAEIPSPNWCKRSLPMSLSFTAISHTLKLVLSSQSPPVMTLTLRRS